MNELVAETRRHFKIIMVFMPNADTENGEFRFKFKYGFFYLTFSRLKFRLKL